MDGLGKVGSRYRWWFEGWGNEEKTVEVLGCIKWPKKDRDKVDRLGKTFLRHLWQSRKERLAIGDRSCGNNLRPLEDAWSLVNQLRHAKHEYAPPVKLRPIIPPVRFRGWIGRGRVGCSGMEL